MQETSVACFSYELDANKLNYENREFSFLKRYATVNEHHKYLEVT